MTTKSSLSRNQPSQLSAHDLEALKVHHEFVRDDEKDREQLNYSWEKRMARKFYNKLFKEFALIDLSRYKEGKIGLRWRSEKEVESGKGQHSCGSLTCESNSTSSSSSTTLRSFEVPFKYVENGEDKIELVKVRLCQECSEKLFHHKVKEIKGSGKTDRKRKIENTQCSANHLSQKERSGIKRQVLDNKGSHEMTASDACNSKKDENVPQDS